MRVGTDRRRSAPATGRNRVPILDVLRRVLPADGTILETGSGTGEHAVFFAPALAPRPYLPSEPDSALRDSVEAWSKDVPAANLCSPLALDVTALQWPVECEPQPEPPVTAILSINMIHIAPWTVCIGLLAGAGRILKSGGVLYFYGPFRLMDGTIAPSNAAFDRSLRAENDSWGVRSLHSLADAAAAEGLILHETVEMPADNLSVILKRQVSSGAKTKPV